MTTQLTAITTESTRIADLAAVSNPLSAVPSCPGWTLADLIWHVAEVQYFWASIVSDLLQKPDRVPQLKRPADAELQSLLIEQTERLTTALAAHPPDTECWSWHEPGRYVGWVIRRQVHEALVHRVDAELAADALTPIDDELAADGVAEILEVMLDASDLPGWATFEPDGRTALLASNAGLAWALELGRFRGTSPASGTDYNDPALRLVEESVTPTATISGSAAALDLWLWGRGGVGELVVAGDDEVPTMIRAAAVAGTQ